MQKKFLDIVKRRARQNPKRIFFPETFDPRTLEAVKKIKEEGTAIPVLLGKKEDFPTEFSAFEFLHQEESERFEIYVKKFFELRKSKGVTLEDARRIMKDRNYFAVMAVETGDVDGLISGANVPTSETLRPAFEIIKTKEKFHKVSGFFFMILERRLLMFADCVVNIDPNSHDLADIAIDSAETAKRFGIEPRIALLSFSTAGSAKHPHADKVREAVAFVKDRRPDLLCEGEMQVDAALVPDVCKRKFPNSKIQGNANILIFPNLDAANISYKLVERLGRAEAVGPILQGLKKPVNDLSRGCSVDDIVDLAAITTVEAQGEPLLLPPSLTSLK